MRLCPARSSPPSALPPSFQHGELAARSGQRALPHIPPMGHRVRRPLRGALPGHFPSFHNSPPSKPPSVLPNLLRTTKKIPLFPQKKPLPDFPPLHAASHPSTAPGCGAHLAGGFLETAAALLRTPSDPRRAAPGCKATVKAAPRALPRGEQEIAKSFGDREPTAPVVRAPPALLSGYSHSPPAQKK